MNTDESLEDAVGVLQQLGLKEYEARCFVGLTRLDTATAKQLSELTEVPRTRVYDAIRVLEAQGLVEIQHTSPRRFRAVSLDEAADTLQDQYESRIERFRDALSTVDVVDAEGHRPVHEVWAMSGCEAIEHRTNDLVDGATEEVVLVLGDEALLTDELVECLNAVPDDVELIVGAVGDPLQERIRSAVSGATTYVSGLGWLDAEPAGESEPSIGRLLLVDRSAILVSTLVAETMTEQAVFGEGFGNGLVVVARRLMAQGLVAARDPAP